MLDNDEQARFYLDKRLVANNNQSNYNQYIVSFSKSKSNNKWKISLVFHHGLKVKELISCMGSFGLQNSCHPVWQRVVELVDEVVGMAWKATLQASPKLLQVLRLGPPSFFLHSSPDMLNNINIWRLCWPSLNDLDLLPPEKLHSGTWGMARSSILLKNLTPLVVVNVLRGRNLLIFGIINVTIHLTDLPGTSLLDATPNHNLSTSSLLGEPWVQTGPWGSSTILAALGMELNWRFSAVQPSPRPTA